MHDGQAAVLRRGLQRARDVEPVVARTEQEVEDLDVAAVLRGCRAFLP
jgi:hypothetical protein